MGVANLECSPPFGVFQSSKQQVLATPDLGAFVFTSHMKWSLNMKYHPPLWLTCDLCCVLLRCAVTPGRHSCTPPQALLGPTPTCSWCCWHWACC